MMLLGIPVKILSPANNLQRTDQRVYLQLVVVLIGVGVVGVGLEQRVLLFLVCTHVHG